MTEQQRVAEWMEANGFEWDYPGEEDIERYWLKGKFAFTKEEATFFWRASLQARRDELDKVNKPELLELDGIHHVLNRRGELTHLLESGKEKTL